MFRFGSVFILCLILGMPLAWSQNLDTSTTFDLDKYLLVLENHPVWRQAKLLDQQSIAYLMKARGAFDPKLKGNYEQKSFDGKNYFTIGEFGLQLPTYYGVELKANFNWSDGIFLNPERTLPVEGQAVLGASVPVWQGLKIDERRASLAQAKIMDDLNKAQQAVAINQLFKEAFEVYWEWVLKGHLLEIAEEAVRLAEVRKNAVLFNFQQGYYTAMDTLEATIQLRNRSLNLESAKLEFQNARNDLSVFLWNQNGQAIELRPDVAFPPLEEAMRVVSTELFLEGENLVTTHPEIKAMEFQIEQGNIDLQMKREKLKPNIRINYNLLANGWNFQAQDLETQGALAGVFSDNYKWGVDLSFPLFTRKERGDLSLTQIKQDQRSLKQQQKYLSLLNKLGNYNNYIQANLDQISMMEEIQSQYRALLDGESEKFRLGASSLFLLNSREVKWIEAQQKLLSLKGKALKYYYTFLAEYNQIG